MIYIVANFDPLPPSVHVPEELIQFVPPRPIYNKKKTVYHPPGSPYRFSHIHRLARQAERSITTLATRRKEESVHKRAIEQ